MLADGKCLLERITITPIQQYNSYTGKIRQL
jgi:hypothetical protein